MKEPPGFFFVRLAHSNGPVQRAALRLLLRPKKKKREEKRERETIFASETRARSRAPERGKEKIEMLISHRVDGGNYVLMRSRLAKSPGKRDTRPDLRTRNGVPSLFLSPPLVFQPPATHGERMLRSKRIYVRVYMCEVHTYARGVIRQSRSS